MEIFHPIHQLESTGLVKAGISLRHGGTSRSPYTSLNLASHVGDEPDAVASNRRVFLQRTGFAPFVYCHQIHSNCVINVDVEPLSTEKLCGAPEDIPGDSYLPFGCFSGELVSDDIQAADALITARHRLGLGIFTADCVPIFILDTVTPAIGIVHAGWRGTLGRIAQNVISRMKAQLGTAADHCLIHLGPSIQKCCYTVSPELLFQFEAHFGKTVRKGTHLSLQTANILQLVAYGVPPSTISVSPFCTACCTEMFYSHRASTGQTGRMVSFIMLQTKKP